VRSAEWWRGRALGATEPYYTPRLLSRENFRRHTLPRHFALAAAKRSPLRCVKLSLPIPPLRFAVLWQSRSDGDSALQAVRRQIVAAARAVSRRLKPLR
jgi:hypothetical protein